MLDGAYLSSSLRLLEGTIVLGLSRTTLLPSEDGFTFDVIGLQILDVVSLTNGLNQSTHLVGKLGDKDHGLKVRRDGAFGCCHSSKPDEDGVDSECMVSVSGDDDIHRRFEFLVGGGDSGFAVSGLEVLPCYGSKHCGNIGVFLMVFSRRFKTVVASVGWRRSMMFPRALSLVSNQEVISDWFVGGLEVSAIISVWVPSASVLVTVVVDSYSGAGNLFAITLH